MRRVFILSIITILCTFSACVPFGGERNMFHFSTGSGREILWSAMSDIIPDEVVADAPVVYAHEPAAPVFIDHPVATPTPAVVAVVDDEPPVITGARDITLMAGSAVAYSQGVSVSDNMDEAVELAIDAGQVNTSVPGVYELVYSATDNAGNVARVSVNVNVIAIEPEDTQALVAATLSGLINDDMNDEQKARAIFDYVVRRIKYAGNRVYGEPHVEVYLGITNGRGDCYSYAIVSQYLLDEADIPNMMLTRVGGRTRHFWNLVYAREGWYHFDSCPNSDSSSDERFLFDENMALDITARGAGRIPEYYTYDHSLYPAVAGCMVCAGEPVEPVEPVD